MVSWAWLVAQIRVHTFKRRRYFLVVGGMHTASIDFQRRDVNEGNPCPSSITQKNDALVLDTNR